MTMNYISTSSGLRTISSNTQKRKHRETYKLPIYDKKDIERKIVKKYFRWMNQ